MIDARAGTDPGDVWGIDTVIVSSARNVRTMFSAPTVIIPGHLIMAVRNTGILGETSFQGALRRMTRADLFSAEWMLRINQNKSE